MPALRYASRDKYSRWGWRANACLHGTCEKAEWGDMMEYNFKEFIVPLERPTEDMQILEYSEKWREVYHKAILEILIPIIDKLEAENLINSYHFIFKGALYVRVSSISWERAKKLIPYKLHEFNLDHYFIPELYYSQLYQNSLFIIELIKTAKDKASMKILIEHITHLLFAQYGICALEEILQHADRIALQCYTLNDRNGIDIIEYVADYLKENKNEIYDIIKQLQEKGGR
jgi:hypothetical protein